MTAVLKYVKKTFLTYQIEEIDSKKCSHKLGSRENLDH